MPWIFLLNLVRYLLSQNFLSYLSDHERMYIEIEEKMKVPSYIISKKEYFTKRMFFLRGLLYSKQMQNGFAENAKCNIARHVLLILESVYAYSWMPHIYWVS